MAPMLSIYQNRPPTSISSVYFDTLRPDSRASMKVCCRRSTFESLNVTAILYTFSEPGIIGVNDTQRVPGYPGQTAGA